MSRRAAPKTIEPERFVLRDREGEARAVLKTAQDGGPRLAMGDDKGKDRLELMAARDGAPVVNLLDQDGKVCLEIPVGCGGVSDRNVLDDEKIRLNLGVAKSGAPELALLDRDESSGLTLTVTPHGAVVLGDHQAGLGIRRVRGLRRGVRSVSLRERWRYSPDRASVTRAARPSPLKSNGYFAPTTVAEIAGSPG